MKWKNTKHLRNTIYKAKRKTQLHNICMQNITDDNKEASPAAIKCNRLSLGYLNAT